jgi:hypothetical protein
LEILQKHCKDTFLPLAVTCDPVRFEVQVWYSDQRLSVPDLLYSEEITDPKVKSYTVPWTKKSKIVSVGSYYSYSSTSSYTFTDQNMPWQGYRDRVIREWSDNIDLMREDWRGEKAADAKKKEIQNRYNYATKLLEDQIYQEKISTARWEFFQEHGDPDLWDDHLKLLRISKPSFSILSEALRWYSERGVNPVGQTVGMVLNQAREWGLGQRKKGYWDPDYESTPKELLLGWIIPEPQGDDTV